MKRLATMVGALLISTQAYAADEVQLADNNTPAPRFMSLAAERSGVPKVRGRDGLPVSVTRSDRNAMSNGFMRIDRARSAALPMQHALIVPISSTKPQAGDDAPRIIRGTEAAVAPDSEAPSGENASTDPVLSLFNGSGQSTLSSFHDALRGGGMPVIAGKQLWPVASTAPQKISSGYGMRNDPINGKPEFHGGIDISAATGTPVLATAAATVAKVGQDANYGKFITLLQAGGIENHYGHLSAQNVREGDRVNAGQVIGAVGATGRTTGAHLDYRISMSGAKIDPMSVLTLPAGVRAAASARPMAPTATQAVASRASYRPMPKPIRDMQVKVVTVN